MKMQRSLVLFSVVAVVALIAVASMPASQQASARHKVHTVSTQVSTTVAVHHKVHTASKGKISVHQVAVIPEAHGKPDVVLQNATAMKALVKGPYGESDVIGGMMSGGY
jgi:Tfp pilus assembly protein PilE